jgi:hypothetical protein
MKFKPKSETYENTRLQNSGDSGKSPEFPPEMMEIVFARG